jgi:hypothetical protein
MKRLYLQQNLFRQITSISNTFNPQSLNIGYGTKKNINAIDIFNKSCYHKVDFKINEKIYMRWSRSSVHEFEHRHGY